jgi:1,4-alpha-glucan branching enzyme
MPGDDWQRFANLRLLLGSMWAQPGKKLLFMGCEIAQWREWDHDGSLDWELLERPAHAGIQRWVEDLNRLYRDEPALHETDTDASRFEWVDANDNEAGVTTFLRRSRSDDDVVLVAANHMPLPRPNYRVGVDGTGGWREMLNSDATLYGGSGVGNLGGVESLPVPMHGRPRSVLLTLPPLGIVFLKHEGGASS